MNLIKRECGKRDCSESNSQKIGQLTTRADWPPKNSKNLFGSMDTVPPPKYFAKTGKKRSQSGTIRKVFEIFRKGIGGIRSYAER